MPLILLTNDDGVNAPGLQALFQAMQRLGRTIIVAPERDNSAVSHSLTMNRPLRVREIGSDRYTLDGTPTDCVTLGISKILKEKPALLVSGINPGGNLGDDISYSGTVSAAVEATMLGVPSIAVSLAGEEPFLFESAAAISAKIAGIVLERGLPKDTLLNINIPNLPPAEIAGVSFTRQGRRVYDNAIKEISDPWGRRHYWIGGGIPSWDRGNDTDSGAIAAGRISISPIHLDLTNYDALDYLTREWKGLDIIND